ncbi:Calcium transporting ATPase [Klebsormidium nitens]|uniref:Calcium-transporting ATPase n=1 Tax=Klebsormidium nitens TaxID=105231 RepID=A0A1Y1I9G8_KLENI|nr:Calcium transporting ATPase [Klebsormidium nitens]|eukprot:GAQ87615.1 Calcium transporting ATPase [Klebsormidium nitens]
MAGAVKPLASPQLSEAGQVMDDEDPFIIPPKPPVDALRKWRSATLALNASRRFRYTANLNRVEERRLQRLGRFKTAGHVAMAAARFKNSTLKKTQEVAVPADYTAEELSDLVAAGDASVLPQLGGVQGICQTLKTDPEDGISGTPEDVAARQEKFGTNTHPEKPRKPFWRFVWEACQDTTLIILAICAVVSLAVEMNTQGTKTGWYDGAGIGFAVTLCVFVTAISDWRQSLQFANLNKEKGKIYINVVRGGKREKVLIFDLVVGDIIFLNIGDQVPGDGIFVQGHQLTIDESSMTGESQPMHKNEQKPFMMAGTKVSDGMGTMVLTGVGMHTEWGKVMATLSEDVDEETPLQVRLNGAATAIGKMGLLVAVFTFIVLMIRFFATVDYGHFGGEEGNRIVEYFSIAVTIVVVAVPEGLPLAVTLTLAYSMRKMMNDKALVRHLAACETMGSATTICSDKTGTLTLNQMSVVASWICGSLKEPDTLATALQDDALGLLKESVFNNTNGSVFVPKDGGAPEVSGSPTEAAVLTFGVKLGGNFEETKALASVIAIEPFNSAKKRMGVAVKRKDGSVRVHWKGASEIVLGLCTSFLDSDNQVHALTPEKVQELQGEIQRMAEGSLRTLCLAYKELDPASIPAGSLEEWPVPEEGLTCMAIVGIKDPCRPGVPEAVALCQRAGVMVRMVTGDNVVTAKAIAKECGILTEGGVAIEGKDFRVMSIEEQEKLLPRLQVMARSSPTDKHMLVKRLRAMGNVVGVTGDGTNDAPALHEADIGLSMGIAGTEVAKESSDIIILDDNFASIVKVIRWGRSVYVNIQKFIQFQLTVNVVALSINFVSALASGNVPLTAVQLLWVNLIMDTLGALALATEPPTDDLLLRPPVGRTAPLITNFMFRNIAGQAVYQLIVLFTLQFGGKSIFGFSDAGYPPPRVGKETHSTLLNGTMIFNAFVFCQIFNEISSRKPEQVNCFEGFFKNKMFVGIIFITIGLQIIIVEFLGDFATTTPLNWWQWIVCVIIGLVGMPIAALVKLLPVPNKPFPETRYFRWLTKILISRKKRKAHAELKAKAAGHNGSAEAEGAAIELAQAGETPAGVASGHLPVANGNGEYANGKSEIKAGKVV